MGADRTNPETGLAGAGHAAARHVAALAPNGVVLEHPMRKAHVSWRRREEVYPDQAAVARELEARVRGLRTAFEGAHVAIEGVCRVELSERSGARGAVVERGTALVVHVTADGEPVRTVILPME